MSDRDSNPESKPTDPKVRKFLQQAEAIIASERGLNQQSEAKLRLAANQLGMPNSLFQETLESLRLTKVHQNWTRYESAFLKFLDREFEKLKGDLLSPSAEKAAIEHGKSKYQLTEIRAEQLLEFQSESKGIARIDSEGALNYAEAQIRETIGSEVEIDEEKLDFIHAIASKWAIEKALIETIVANSIRQNRMEQTSRKNRARLKFLSLGFLASIVLSIGYLVVVTVEWNPSNNPTVDRPNEPGSASLDAKSPRIGWLPPVQNQTLKDLSQSNETWSAVSDLLPVSPPEDSELENLLIQLTLDSQSDFDNQPFNLITSIFLNHPNPVFQTRWLKKLEARTIFNFDSPPLTIKQIRDAFEANRFLEKLILESSSLADNSPIKLGLARLAENNGSDQSAKKSNRRIALDLWNLLTRQLELGHVSPGLIPALTEVTAPFVDPTTHRLRISFIVLGYLEKGNRDWQQMQSSIRSSIAHSDQTDLSCWIALFKKSDSKSFQAFIGPLLLTKLKIAAKTSRVDDIVNAITKFELQTRLESLRPLTERMQQVDRLRKLSAKSIQPIPDRIAWHAEMINLEMILLKRIVDHSWNQKSLWDEFDIRVQKSPPVLADVVPISSVSKSQTSVDPSGPTASDKRTLNSAIARLKNLDANSERLRILALEQLSRVGPRFPRLDKSSTNVLLNYLPQKYSLRESLEIEKTMASISHWPRLLVGIADLLEDSPSQRMLDLARRCQQQSNLQSNANYDPNDASDLQIRLLNQAIVNLEIAKTVDSKNESLNWTRLRVYLDQAYQERQQILDAPKTKFAVESSFFESNLSLFNWLNSQCFD
ncbi:MAG: hypothetical protein AAF623_11795, partial [Planctomycetota bacterium]